MTLLGPWSGYGGLRRLSSHGSRHRWSGGHLDTPSRAESLGTLVPRGKESHVHRANRPSTASPMIDFSVGFANELQLQRFTT